MNAFIKTGTGITIFFAEDNSQHTVKSDHPRFADICKMAAEDRFHEILDAIDMRRAVDNFIYDSKNGRFTIANGVLTFDGDPIHSTLADRMIDMAMEKLDLTALENFMVNLMANPSYRAVTELYSFLEAGELPITSDGHFLAYKKISMDYKDCHTGTMDNSIGATVSMPRNKVNEDKNQTCSTGLHFCSYEYLNHFSGARVVVLKINPRDVVSIPSDYNDTKGRACQYEVLREIEDWVSTRLYGIVSDDGIDDRDYDEETGEVVCQECYEVQSECECEFCSECGEVDCDLDCVDYSDDDEEDSDDYDPEFDHEDDDDLDDTAEITTGGVSMNEIEVESADDVIERLLSGDLTDASDIIVAINPFDYSQDDEDAIDDAIQRRIDETYTQMMEQAPVPVEPTHIKCVDQRTTVTYYFDSVEEAHADTKVPMEYIRRVLKGQKGSSLGYSFEEVTK